MKIPRLPLTDLARIAVLPQDQQRSALMQVRSSGGGGPSYNPVRSSFSDIVNLKPGCFPAHRTPWKVIEKNLSNLSRSDVEKDMNCKVGKSLNDYCVINNLESMELEANPIRFSLGPKLTCWSGALFIYKDRITIPFVDYRKGNSLSTLAMNFIFSLQNEAVRMNNPDYREVGLEIVKFRNDTLRSVYTVNESGFKLYTFQELELMTSFTQELWIFICEARTNAKRRSSGGRGGLV